MKKTLFIAGAVLFSVAACKSSFGDIPTSVPLGFLTLATGDAATNIHKTYPVAYFVDAVNVQIPSSQTSADTCTQIPFPGTVTPTPLSQIDAGTPAVVAMTADTAVLTPQEPDVNGYVFYRLPAGDSLLVSPGSSGKFTIAGAENGFHAFTVDFTTADSLKINPIDASADSTGELPITWNEQASPKASVVIQLEFTTTSTGLPNQQILCQFTDNGSHSVEPNLANIWRRGFTKRVHAYRFITTNASDASQRVVVLSQYSTDATQIINPGS